MNTTLLLLAGALEAYLLVLGGWLLNELSSLIRLRREDRRLAGPVLTDLLEIRHRITTVNEMTKEYVNEVGKHVEIPPQVRLQLQQYFQIQFPQPPQFLEKYEEAVSTLARVDPIRAFRLRDQLLIAPMLTQLQGLASATRTDTAIWISILEPELLGKFKAHIEELILDVARAHGWLAWWRSRRILRKPILSEADKNWISTIVDKAKKASEDAQKA
jgi:hypothetical protein